MKKIDCVDEALSRLARTEQTLPESFVEDLAMKMKHEPRQRVPVNRVWSLMAITVMGLSTLGAVAYAAKSFFLWEVPIFGVSGDGELTQGYAGVMDAYEDEETGDFVTEMMMEDGNRVTFLSSEKVEVKGFVSMKESDGEYELTDHELPSNAVLRVDHLNPLDKPRVLKTPDGKTLILSNGFPPKD